MVDATQIQVENTLKAEEKKVRRMQIGGVWHVLVMVGYHRGWPEWHWIKEDEHLRSQGK